MKKVLVALAMVMGLGSSVAFAFVVSGTQSVEQTQQNPQDEFTKVEVKDLPQAVMNVLAKDYEGAVGRLLSIYPIAWVSYIRSRCLTELSKKRGGVRIRRGYIRFLYTGTR